MRCLPNSDISPDGPVLELSLRKELRGKAASRPVLLASPCWAEVVSWARR